MGRFLTLVALGALVWWGYSAFGRGGGTSSGESEIPSMEDVITDRGSAQEAASGRSDGRPTDAVVESPRDDESADRLDAFLTALDGGDAALAARAFDVLAAAKTDSDRRRVSDAIERASERETTAASLTRLLGQSNSFLHSATGRKLALTALERIHQLPAEEAFKASTQLLESAMRGPIRLVDRDARTTVDAIYARHLHLVRQVAFDPANSAAARQHEVQPGESLDGIARKFRQSGLPIEAGTLAIVNRISDPRRLRAGQVLRVPVAPVRCVANRSSFLLATYLGEDLVRLYWMAHGKPGHDTPATTFTVGEKIADPDWHFDGAVIPFGDPRNPLGRFFVKFEHQSYTGFGAHGTNEPETIGSEASLGCLRLLPNDIEEFARFVPKGTSVEVR